MATIDGLLSIRIKDFLGDEASMPLYVTMSDAQTLAALDTYAGTILTDLDAILDPQIVGATLNVNVPLPGGLRSSPNSGSSLNDNALFNYKITGLTNRSFSNDVIGFTQVLIVNGQINLADPAVIAWQTLFTPSSGLLQPVSSDWQTLGSFRYCKLSTRKHRRALTKSSTETP